MSKFAKIVETPHYHVWTDALHARSLARQARNEWDRGTYVRWCVTTAWTALEIACQKALEDDSISYRFKDRLDDAIEEMDLPPLKWGAGIWQQVASVQDLRKDFVHRFVAQANLFPDADVADKAIDAIRDAMVDIYKHVGRPAPPWTADDEDRGWDNKHGVTASATVIRAGADPDGSDAIRICFVRDAIEHPSEVLPAGTEWKPHVDGLIRSVRVPISEVRVYRGKELVHSRQVPMRGS